MSRCRPRGTKKPLNRAADEAVCRFSRYARGYRPRPTFSPLVAGREFPAARESDLFRARRKTRDTVKHARGGGKGRRRRWSEEGRRARLALKKERERDDTEDVEEMIGPSICRARTER